MRMVGIVFAAWICLAANAGAADSSTPSVGRGMAKSCNCFPMPVVNTSDKPAKEIVQYQLDLNDLETIFSNRDLVYGSSESADAALRQAIDPDGSLGLYKGGAPHKTTGIKLKEGWGSSYLIHGPPPLPSQAVIRQNLQAALARIQAAKAAGLPPPSPRKLAPGQKQISYDPSVRTSHTSGVLTAASTLRAPSAYANSLLLTIARCNKYGEPSLGLRKSSILLLRLLLDLGSITRKIGSTPSHPINLQFGSSAPAPLPVDRQEWLHGEGGTVRFHLSRLIQNTGPATLAIVAEHAKGNTQPDQKSYLKLDVFDLANAVLDVVRPESEDGKETALLSLRIVKNTERTGADSLTLLALIEAASGSQKFGGNAKPGSEQDSIACKAYNTLVASVDSANPDEEAGELIRARMLEEAQGVAGYVGTAGGIPDSLRRPNARRLQAEGLVEREALITAGFGSADEARRVTNTLFSAYSYTFDDSHFPRENAPPPRDAAQVEAKRLFEKEAIKSLMTEAGGANRDTFRSTVAAVVQSWIAPLQNSSPDRLNASQKRLLADWNSGSPVVALGAVGAPCPGESCSSRMKKEQPEAEEENFEADATIEIHNKLVGIVGAKSLDSVCLEEPYFIVVRIPTTDSASNAPSIQVKLTPNSPAWTKMHIGSPATQTTVTLKNRGSGPDGRIIFANPKPITIKKGGEGTSPFDVHNGSSVAAEYGDEGIKFNVYDDENEQAIGRAYHSLLVLQAYYNAVLQSPNVPAKDKTPDGWVHKKLKAVGNALYILTYDPGKDPNTPITPLSKGMIGEGYLGFLQGPPSEWNNPMNCGSLPGQGFPGADARFKSKISYDSCEEAQVVKGAFYFAAEKQSVAAFASLRQLNIMLVNVTAQSVCFETATAVAGPVIANEACNQDFVGLLLGDTPKEEQLDVTDQFLSGVGNHLPLVLHGAQLAWDLHQLPMGEEFGSKNKMPTALAEGVEDEFAALRSKDLELATDISEIQTNTDKLWDETATFRVNEDASIPGARSTAPDDLTRVGSPKTAGGPNKLDVKRQISRPGYAMQVENNTCELTNLEQSRREAFPNAPKRNGGQLISRAKQLSQEEGWLNYRLKKMTANNDLDDIYIPATDKYDGGTTTDGAMYFAMKDGAQVWRPGGKCNVKDYVLQLQKKRHLLVAINVAPPGHEKVWHSVRITEIFQDHRGNFWIEYGDPANGKFWYADACTFEDHTKYNSVLVLDWSKAQAAAQGLSAPGASTRSVRAPPKIKTPRTR